MPQQEGSSFGESRNGARGGGKPLLQPLPSSVTSQKCQHFGIMETNNWNCAVIEMFGIWRVPAMGRAASGNVIPARISGAGEHHLPRAQGCEFKRRGCIRPSGRPITWKPPSSSASSDRDLGLGPGRAHYQLCG